MPAPTDLSELIALLVRSNLLTSEDEIKVRNLSRDLENEPEVLAEAIVDAGVISRWQADRLLAGRHKGFILGPYVLRDLLGKGGMGTVYLAEHRMMRRRVAIKILHAKRLQPGSTLLERFHREARAVAQLDHPNIVRAYDLNREPNGGDDIHYLVMEYVAGESVSKRVQRSGPLSVVDAADIVRQVADGLAHAHARGLVHRDVKPANLMLDEEANVKILDLGLALDWDARSEDSSLTRANDETLLGTADFISPEQALDCHDVDARSDIYSLGCTFFYMLAGRPPFHTGSVTKRLVAHQVDPLPPVRANRPDVPDTIVEVIGRMTVKEPGDRFQSAEEVVRILTDWLLVHGDADWRARNSELTGEGSTLAASATSDTAHDGRPPLTDTDVPIPDKSLVPETSDEIDQVPAVPVGVAPPDDSTSPATPTESADRRSPWLGVGVAAAVIVALLAGIWFVSQPWGGEPSPTTPPAPSGHVADSGQDDAPPDVPTPLEEPPDLLTTIRESEETLLLLSFDGSASLDELRNEAAAGPLADIAIETEGEPRLVVGRHSESKALRLRGKDFDDHLVIGRETPEAFEMKSDLTFALWFRVDPRWQVWFQSLVSKGDTGYRIQRSSGDSVLMFAINAHAARANPAYEIPVDVETVAETPAVDDGEWHMVVGVVDRKGEESELRIYVDGELRGTAVSEHHQAPNGFALRIGANGSFLEERRSPDGLRTIQRRTFAGEIDDVLILSRALTDDEVRELYEAQK